MYELGDQSWRSRPQVMSHGVIDDLARRIAEHTAEHEIPEVEIVLHGGEPLLAGAETISYAVRTIRTALRPRSQATFCIQTNGVLLDQRFLNLFEDLDLRIGLSLDGDAEMHDRHRRHADGRGSYARVAAAAKLLAEHPRLFSGMLSVIDLRNDPVRTYEALAAFGPPVIDFLLPHGNWTAPPPGRPTTNDSAPYGDWLVAVFDHWYHAGTGAPRVRLFEEIMCLLLGGSSRIEDVGLSPLTMVVVESDGGIALSDVLPALAGVASANVAAQGFGAALRAALPATAKLAAQCRACPIGSVCGGGLYAHRYRAGHGFDNPSVYCADLFRLITRIRDRLDTDLAGVSPGTR
jgi:uncharacterized protein